MNIDNLIIAAKKIDRKAQKQESRAEAWQQLAADARKPDADSKYIERRKKQLDSSVVVDFGTAINELRRALKAK